MICLESLNQSNPLNSQKHNWIRYLKPTPVNYLPLIASIAPAYLRRYAATLNLSRRFQDQEHHFHHLILRPNQRLKSWWPFGKPLAALDSTVKPNESISTWQQHLRLEQWSTQRPSTGLLDPHNECPKININHLDWVKLIRLRIGCFKPQLENGKKPSVPMWIRRETTASCIILGQYLSHIFPGNIEDLAQTTLFVCSWLAKTFLYI